MVYGAVDFCVSYGRVSGLFGIGASRMKIIDMHTGIVNLGFLAAVCVVLILMNAYLLDRKDFIVKSEER